MAVPKKRRSKTKKSIRRYGWRKKAYTWKQKALNFGLKILTSSQLQP